MATALDIIKRSMRLLGVYQIGEAPSADESADMLSSLNAMMDAMSVQKLFIPVKSLDTISLTVGVSSYTVGTSGVTITTRPLQVLDESTITFGSVTYPLTKVALSDFNEIAVPTVQGIPTTLYVLANMPNITVKLYPVPTSNMTLNLWSIKQLQQFTSLTDVVNLPPAYEMYLANAFAEVAAPEFGIQAPPSVVKQAANARKNIKRINLEIPILSMPNSIANRYRWSIYG